MTNVLLNFSGHNLSVEAARQLETRFSAVENFEPLELNFDGNVGDQIGSLIKKSSTKLDGSVPISLILPGQSTYAVLLIAYLNGLLGYYPDIIFLKAEQTGHYLPSSIFSLETTDIRLGGRVFRQELFKKGKTS